MNTLNTATIQFVVCVDNSNYSASLERHKIYRVLPDPDAAEDGDIRIIDESGDDYLYPATRFVAIMLPHEIRSTFGQEA